MTRPAPGDGPAPAGAGEAADHESLARLLVRTAAGDDDAWRELLGLYARRVYAMARSRLKRDDLAEEITQSVFATVATKLTAGDYTEQGRFESWLFRVTMNRVRDEVRRARHRPEAMDPSDFAQVPSSEPDSTSRPASDDLDALRTAIDSLTEPDRELIELRHHAGMSFKLIAAHLGKPLGTVLARHHRALAKLRNILEEPDQHRTGSSPTQWGSP